MEFARWIGWERLGDGVYQGEFAPEWGQGRGIFGGIQAAVILHAMSREVSDDARQVRTFAMHFCAPARPERGQVRVSLARVGSRVTQCTARLVQGGDVVATALGTFASAREVLPGLEAPKPPAMVPLDKALVLGDHPRAPAFTRLLDFGYTCGGVPYCGSDVTNIGGWCRLREPTPMSPTVAAVLMDAWPPPALARYDRRVGAATVDLTYVFPCVLPLANDVAGAHHYFVSDITYGGDGYTEAAGALWTDDGQLLGISRQLTAFFG